MNKAQIMELLNKNQVCYLATAEAGMPHVRGMMMYGADEKGLLFHTGQAKDLVKQLSSNPQVEACFFSPSEQVQVRVSGKAEFISDQKLKEEIVNKRQFLKPLVEQYGYDSLAVFRVTGCKATVWTMEANFAPKSYVDL